MKANATLLSRFFKLVCETDDWLSKGYRSETSAGQPTFERIEETLKSKQAPPESDRGGALAAIAEKAGRCTQCRLHMGRKRSVAGHGALDPVIMIVGEGPDEEDERTGAAFSGPSGGYLIKWLDAIGLSREKECFVTNVIKCRPPQNRQPSDDECEACFPFLVDQIGTLRPRTILAVGLVAARLFTRRTNEAVSSLRERAYEYKGIPCLVTHHPGSVLRDPSLRKPVWDDLKKLKGIIDGLDRRRVDG
jgi:uracil-DNA glycosylase family 4